VKDAFIEAHRTPGSAELGPFDFHLPEHFIWFSGMPSMAQQTSDNNICSYQLSI
jgi:hypothetical protein